MREIKFRAWLPAIKKMTYAHTLDELMNWDTEKENNGTAIWLQYTGLKDKHGKEIYEGDVVRHNQGMVYKIEYLAESRGQMRFAAVGSSGWLAGFNVKAMEVIGNVFENPALLGGDQQ